MLCNPCIYNCVILRTLAHLQPEPWHSQNSLFKDFQGYLGIFRDIDAYLATLTGAQLGERGEASKLKKVS